MMVGVLTGNIFSIMNNFFVCPEMWHLATL